MPSWQADGLVAYLARTFHAFLGIIGFIIVITRACAGPYSEPGESSPQTHNFFLCDTYFNLLLRVPSSVLGCVHFLSPPLSAYLILLHLITLILFNER